VTSTGADGGRRTSGATEVIIVDASGLPGECAAFPEQTPSRTVVLPPPQLTIGRTSSSRGTHPEIDLSDTDPGVSPSHALLTLSVDGCGSCPTSARPTAPI